MLANSHDRDSLEAEPTLLDCSEDAAMRGLAYFLLPACAAWAIFFALAIRALLG